MNGKPKVAIILTECTHVHGTANPWFYATKSISVPVTRIAKVEEQKDRPAVSAEVPGPYLDKLPCARITLRTPEDYILVKEDVATITARMNGEREAA